MTTKSIILMLMEISYCCFQIIFDCLQKWKGKYLSCNCWRSNEKIECLLISVRPQKRTFFQKSDSSWYEWAWYFSAATKGNILSIHTSHISSAISLSMFRHLKSMFFSHRKWQIASYCFSDMSLEFKIHFSVLYSFVSKT